MNLLTANDTRLTDVLTANEIILVKSKCDEILSALEQYDKALDDAFLHSDMIGLEEHEVMKVFFTKCFFKALRDMNELGVKNKLEAFEQEMKNLDNTIHTRPELFTATEDLAIATARLGSVLESLENF